jgi:hypothetical protein
VYESVARVEGLEQRPSPIVEAAEAGGLNTLGSQHVADHCGGVALHLEGYGRRQQATLVLESSVGE